MGEKEEGGGGDGGGRLEDSNSVYIRFYTNP